MVASPQCRIDHSHTDLIAAIESAPPTAFRPMLMTGLALFMGLIPIMLSHGSGADIAKRIATPMLGGVASALIMVLVDRGLQCMAALTGTPITILNLKQRMHELERLFNLSRGSNADRPILKDIENTD